MQTAEIIAPAAFHRGQSASDPPPAIPSALADTARHFSTALRDYDLAAVAARLGIPHLSRRVIIATIRLLCRNEGFPLPRTIRLLRGRRVVGPQAVTVRSLWQPGPVDAWFDRDLPPAAALRRDVLSIEHSRRALAERATLLAVAS